MNILTAVMQAVTHVGAVQAGESFERNGLVLDGYCAFGMAKGYKAKIDPADFSVIHGTLYLNYSDAVRTRWLSDVPGYIQQAEANWPAVMKLTKVQE